MQGEELHSSSAALLDPVVWGVPHPQLLRVSNEKWHWSARRMDSSLTSAVSSALAGLVSPLTPAGWGSGWEVEAE